MEFLEEKISVFRKNAKNKKDKKEYDGKLKKETKNKNKLCTKRKKNKNKVTNMTDREDRFNKDTEIPDCIRGDTSRSNTPQRNCSNKFENNSSNFQNNSERRSNHDDINKVDKNIDIDFISEKSNCLNPKNEKDKNTAQEPDNHRETSGSNKSLSPHGETVGNDTLTFREAKTDEVLIPLFHTNTEGKRTLTSTNVEATEDGRYHIEIAVRNFPSTEKVPHTCIIRILVRNGSILRKLLRGRLLMGESSKDELEDFCILIVFDSLKKSVEGFLVIRGLARSLDEKQGRSILDDMLQPKHSDMPTGIRKSYSPNTPSPPAPTLPLFKDDTELQKLLELILLITPVPCPATKPVFVLVCSEIFDMALQTCGLKTSTPNTHEQPMNEDTIRAYLIYPNSHRIAEVEFDNRLWFVLDLSQCREFMVDCVDEETNILRQT